MLVWTCCYSFIPLLRSSLVSCLWSWVNQSKYSNFGSEISPFHHQKKAMYRAMLSWYLSTYYMLVTRALILIFSSFSTIFDALKNRKIDLYRVEAHLIIIIFVHTDIFCHSSYISVICFFLWVLVYYVLALHW